MKNKNFWKKKLKIRSIYILQLCSNGYIPIYSLLVKLFVYNNIFTIHKYICGMKFNLGTSVYVFSLVYDIVYFHCYVIQVQYIICAYSTKVCRHKKELNKSLTSDFPEFFPLLVTNIIFHYWNEISLSNSNITIVSRQLFM